MLQLVQRFPGEANAGETMEHELTTDAIRVAGAIHLAIIVANFCKDSVLKGRGFQPSRLGAKKTRAFSPGGKLVWEKNDLSPDLIAARRRRISRHRRA